MWFTARCARFSDGVRELVGVPLVRLGQIGRGRAHPQWLGHLIVHDAADSGKLGGQVARLACAFQKGLCAVARHLDGDDDRTQLHCPQVVLLLVLQRGAVFFSGREPTEPICHQILAPNDDAHSPRQQLHVQSQLRKLQLLLSQRERFLEAVLAKQLVHVCEEGILSVLAVVAVANRDDILGLRGVQDFFCNVMILGFVKNDTLDGLGEYAWCALRCRRLKVNLHLPLLHGHGRNKVVQRNIVEREGIRRHSL